MTKEQIMALVDAYAGYNYGNAVSKEARAAVVAALREALTEKKAEKKTMSKAFCNPARFDGEELAYNNDYLNE